MSNQNNRRVNAWGAIFALALITGCSTASLGPPTLQTQVRSAVTQGHIAVRLDGTTAILTGRVKDIYNRNRALSAAKRFEGVEKVVDNIFISDN